MLIKSPPRNNMKGEKEIQLGKWYIGNNKINYLDALSLFLTLTPAVGPYLVTAHSFQSDSEKYELLGGATNHVSPLHTRPFALLTDIHSLDLLHQSCGQQRHLLVERCQLAGNILKTHRSVKKKKKKAR